MEELADAHGDVSEEDQANGEAEKAQEYRGTKDDEEESSAAAPYDWDYDRYHKHTETIRPCDTTILQRSSVATLRLTTRMPTLGTDPPRTRVYRQR